MVSREIYDAADRKAATACYTTLYNAGVPIYQTNKTFKYCHQKFWIIDGTTVFMSTGNTSLKITLFKPLKKKKEIGATQIILLDLMTFLLMATVDGAK